MVFLLQACAPHDARYYRLHPAALQKALAACAVKSEVVCEEFKNIAEELNGLAYDLRQDPQKFGQKIMVLQITIAAQQEALAQNPNQPDLQRELQQNQQQLTNRLAVVKWLESPEHS